MKKNKLFKQYNIKWLGAYINVLYLTAPLLGIGMYVVNATTLYAVVNKNIHDVVPWLNYPLFLLFMVIGVQIVVAIFFILIYAGYQTFLNKQTYKHNNPIKDVLDAHTKDLAKIKEKLGIIDE